MSGIKNQGGGCSTAVIISLGTPMGKFEDDGQGEWSSRVVLAWDRALFRGRVAASARR